MRTITSRYAPRSSQENRDSVGKSTGTLLDRTEETNMSLDNTSHPGRPGLDELVPSRYALRVGEIDVMVVSDGVLSLPGAMLGSWPSD